MPRRRDRGGAGRPDLPNGAPHCDTCPVKDFCKAGIEQSYASYPKKKPKKARRIEQLTFLLMIADGKILLHQRADKGLLASLWEYPNVEGHLTKEEVNELLASRGAKPLAIRELAKSKHIFTHIEWQIKAYAVYCSKLQPFENELLLTDEQIESEYALPSAFDKYDRKEL